MSNQDIKSEQQRMEGMCAEIKIEIESTALIPDGDISALKGHIKKLVSLQYNASECKAIATKILKKAQAKELNEVDEGMTATELKIHMEAECADEYYWQTLTDRMTANMSHSIEGLRSVLSAEKEELRMLDNA